MFNLALRGWSQALSHRESRGKQIKQHVCGFECCEMESIVVQRAERDPRQSPKLHYNSRASKFLHPSVLQCKSGEVEHMVGLEKQTDKTKQKNSLNYIFHFLGLVYKTKICWSCPHQPQVDCGLFSEQRLETLFWNKGAVWFVCWRVLNVTNGFPITYSVLFVVVAEHNNPSLLWNKTMELRSLRRGGDSIPTLERFVCVRT